MDIAPRIIGGRRCTAELYVQVAPGSIQRTVTGRALESSSIGARFVLADARAQAALSEGWLWLGGILIAVLVGVVIVAFIRRRVRIASRMREPEFSLDQPRSAS